MPAAVARAMRVLIVDDDADTVGSTARMLRVDGHQVATAADGPQTLARVTSFHPELVLLNLGLKEMNGFDVARRIQTLPLHAAPYLVAVTSHSTPEDELRSAEAGFALHLTKPVGIDEFREVALLLETSRRITERCRELAAQNMAITTVLMLQQIEMANVYLDTAALTSVYGLRARYVAHARRAFDRVYAWLHDRASNSDRIAEVATALRVLKARLQQF